STTIDTFTFPYTTLFRSLTNRRSFKVASFIPCSPCAGFSGRREMPPARRAGRRSGSKPATDVGEQRMGENRFEDRATSWRTADGDRKSTRLNSSHLVISY